MTNVLSAERTTDQGNAYDEVPYESYAFPQSHPDRLATIATLLGLQPAPLETCRVLEVGCAGGGNLLPMAEQFPDADFVGIDASQRQIADAQTLVEKAGLTNVRCLHQDLRDVSDDFGRFDYILAHGVYSWIPDDVQRCLLDLCGRHLTEQGVAYVSYNTYPGWHMQEMIRDLMCYRGKSFHTPGERIRSARAVLDFFAKTVPADQQNPYGILLRQGLEEIRESRDDYLLHDYLEEVNSPVYFHQFVERAAASHLQYLGEANFEVMCAGNFTPDVQAMLQAVSADRIEREQFMDFLRNRTFRQTLLCRRDAALLDAPAPDSVTGMHVASSGRPEAPIERVANNERVKFVASGATLTSTDPVVKAAMLCLGESWPHHVAFSALLDRARARLQRERQDADSSHDSDDGQRLAAALIEGYATTYLDLSKLASRFALQAGPRPDATRLARVQAAAGRDVANLRHEPVTLNDLQRHVLQRLDGRTDLDQLVETIAGTVNAGELTIQEERQVVTDAARIRKILQRTLPQCLENLTRMALLKAPSMRVTGDECSEPPGS